ncbi:hypothetical protein PV392_26005 [Streptomyces sp. ME03-5709C]|nr:hypothetical protein [Streptomyces sp. ME03-5709C]
MILHHTTARRTTLCVIDTAAKKAMVAGFLPEHPDAGRSGAAHPALRGCDEVSWADIPGCPAGLPAVLHTLLDERSPRPRGCSPTL